MSEQETSQVSSTPAEVPALNLNAESPRTPRNDQNQSARAKNSARDSSAKTSPIEDLKRQMLAKHPSMSHQSAAFASTSPRFQDAKIQSPPATKYSPKEVSAGIHLTTAASSFKSSSPKYAYLNKAAFQTPPPGSYELDRSKKSFNSPHTSAFGSSSERFKVSKNDPKVYSPPPGWYDVQPHELVDVEGTVRAKVFVEKKSPQK